MIWRGPGRGSLFLLCLRRVLFRPATLVLCVFAVLWLWQDRGGFLAEGETSAMHAEVHWLAPLVVIWWVLLVQHAASLGSQTAQRDASWLAPQGLGTGEYLRLLWGSAVAANGMFLATLLVAASVFFGAGEPPLRIAQRSTLETAQRLDVGNQISGPLEFLAPQDKDRVGLWVLPTVGAAPTTRVRLAIGEGAGADPTLVEGLALIQAEPGNSGWDGERWSLTNLGPGMAAPLASRGLMLLRPQSPAEHLLRVWLRGTLAGAVLAALALACGIWLRPSLATAMALAFGLALFAWWPNAVGHWPAEMESWRQGLGAEALDVVAMISAVIPVLVAGFAARAGWKSWGLDR